MRTWEEERLKCYIFPTVCPCSTFNVHRVHPLNQKYAVEVHNAIKNLDCIEWAELFGSSVNMRCNENSDLDIMIKLRRVGNEDDMRTVHNAIIKSTEKDVDIIWWYPGIEDKEIMVYARKGVQIN